MLVSSQIPRPLRFVSQSNARKYNSGCSERYLITHSKFERHFSCIEASTCSSISLDKVKFWLSTRADMSTEMARLAPNKQSKRRQQETNRLSSSNSARATRSNGPVVTPQSCVPRRTTSLSPSSSHPSLSPNTPPSVSPLSETPLSNPTQENDRDMRRETPRSRVGSNSGHGASRSGRPPLLHSTDETPRSSLSSDESRRDERRATRPSASSDGGLSSGEILKQIQSFCQRQEAFNAKIEEHLSLQTATTVDRERRPRRLPKAVTVRVYLQFY